MHISACDLLEQKTPIEADNTFLLKLPHLFGFCDSLVCVQICRRKKPAQIGFFFFFLKVETFFLSQKKKKSSRWSERLHFILFFRAPKETNTKAAASRRKRRRWLSRLRCSSGRHTERCQLTGGSSVCLGRRSLCGLSLSCCSPASPTY